MLQNWIVGNCSSSHKGQLRWRLPSGDATPQPAQASGSSSLAGRFMSTTKGSQRPFLPGFRNQHFSVLRSHGREKFLKVLGTLSLGFTVPTVRYVGTNLPPDFVSSVVGST